MSDRSGQSLGNYRLIRLLGQGGFAEVYQGQHIHLHTQAAIKILLAARLHDTAEIESFRREAQIIANLTHQHIVRVLDFNIEQGIPYFVMEYAAQGSLRTKHPRGTQLALPTVVSYTRQAASALQYAHEHKQIHRDVKPENILVRDDGSLMLSDFGIATIAHSSASQRTEDMIGTVMYMAPEQTQGRPQPASDQYALAITAYEWLAGKHPFRGTTIEIAMQHATAVPPPLLPQVANLPAAVQQVLFKALAKEPKERFTTVEEFALTLEQAAQGVVPSAGIAPTLPAQNPPRPVARVRQAEPPPVSAGGTPVSAPPPPEMPAGSFFPDTGGAAAPYPPASGPASSPYQPVSGYQPNPYAPPPPYQSISGYQPNPYAPPLYQPVNVYQPAQPGYPSISAPPYQYQVPGPGYVMLRPLYNTTHPHGPTSLSMSPNASAGLSYLFSWITGLIFLLSEKESRFVRFHSLQSLFMSALYFVGFLFLSILSVATSIPDAYGFQTPNPVVTILRSLLALAWFVLWLICMISAFSGKYFKVPLLGDWALRIANRPKRG